MGAAASVSQDLTEEEVQFFASSNALQPILAAVKATAAEKPENAVVIQQLVSHLQNGATQGKALVSGFAVSCCPRHRVITGPIMGEVTSTWANVMVEVESKDNEPCDVTCHVIHKSTDGQVTCVTEITKQCQSRRPVCFHLEGLSPETQYKCVFSGVSRNSALATVSHFSTKAEAPKKLRIVAVSCDRPSRLFHGQVNPWNVMAKDGGLESIDVMLHLGDQVYAYASEEIDVLMGKFDKEYDGLDPEQQAMMVKRGKELMRRKYRQVYGLPPQHRMYRHGSHLMVWSDNDVANDFTTRKKEDGTQGYHPAFLQCAMETYVEYQRMLWDHTSDGDLPRTDAPLREWHGHVYGAVGVFLIDMRGNRINGKGVQLEGPLVCADQWADLEAFCARGELKVLVVASEIPFVTDSPEHVRKAAEKVDFLVDHWCYNEPEIARLLGTVFAWQAAQEGRKCILVGGDVHTGIESVIRDAETGLEIPHLTTSPITNHVAGYFNKNTGQIGERFSWEHNWLGREWRNWAEINVDLEDGRVEVEAKLVKVSTDEYAEMDWCSSDEED